MSILRNIARMSNTTSGAGSPITLGVAISGFIDFHSAGVPDSSATITYLIVDGVNREIGRGVWTNSTKSLTRATVLASTNSGAAITLTTAAEVSVAAAAEDMIWFDEAQTLTTAQQTQIKTNIGATSALTVFTYVATAGQTVFTGADTNSNTGAFATAATVVALNGRVLNPTNDYTISSTTITLLSAANLGDTLSAYSFNTYNLANVVASFNTRTGAVVPDKADYADFFVTKPQGRLTLVTATPYMLTTQSGKNTLFYTQTPEGSRIPIYDGTRYTMRKFPEISVLTTDTTKNPAAIGASKVNHWFVWDDAGTLRLTHSVDWTNDTTESAGAALVVVDGIKLNNVTITNGPAAQRGTWVGTTRSNASSLLDWIIGGDGSGGVGAFLYVFNAHNRFQFQPFSHDNGVTYSYSSGTPRQARASAGNQINVLMGVQEETAHVLGGGENAGTTYAVAGLGLDTTSAFSLTRQVTLLAPTPGESAWNESEFWTIPLGVHFVSRIEAADGVNAVTFNAFNGGRLSMLIRM